jgi:hypothetical protein
VNVDAASCVATGVALGTPTTADNCSVASVTNNAPASYPCWFYQRGLDCNRCFGNTATCTQVVTVTDNILPTITCPAAVSVNAGCSIMCSYWCCSWHSNNC